MTHLPFNKFSWILICTVALLFLSCVDKPAMTPAETSLKLLSLHGLLGKTPEERSKTAKNTLVSKEALSPYFVDLDKYDKFTGELYTGVIIGALARHQSRLLENKKKTTASVTAGHAIIHFDLIGNTWKINLNKTIPNDMKQAAQEEKKRYDAAKAAGQAAAQNVGADS